MPPEILKRAVEPFFSSKPLGKGTGLGLSMVHGLAVQLGGALQLSSTVGKGTTATLVLPVATAAAEVETPGAAAAEDQALRGDPVRRRRSADRDVDHGNAGRSRPPGDRRQFRPARARHHQERTADRPDDDGSCDARHDRDRTRGRLARSCGPRCRSCSRPATPNFPKAPSSICRGWPSPIIRTSCATGSINCSGESRGLRHWQASPQIPLTRH